MAKDQLPEKPTFFVDRNLGRYRVPEAIRAEGYDARSHDDYFENRTTDTEWLKSVGERGWIVLTIDRNIRRNPAELQALIAANVSAFILRLRSPNGDTIVKAITDALPSIVGIVTRKQPPLVAIINKGGSVSELDGYDALVDRAHRREKRIGDSK